MLSVLIRIASMRQYYWVHTTYFFLINKKISLNIFFSWAIWRISWELKNKFDSATVYEPSIFESLKFYYINNIIKTYMACWASAWWPGGLTRAKPFFNSPAPTRNANSVTLPAACNITNNQQMSPDFFKAPETSSF